MAERFGVWVEKQSYGKTSMGIGRTTFLVDPEGRIARVWPKVSVDGHAAEVLEALSAAAAAALTDGTRRGCRRRHKKTSLVGGDERRLCANDSAPAARNQVPIWLNFQATTHRLRGTEVR